MAVSYVASDTTSWDEAGSFTHNYSYTTTSGSDKILVVIVHEHGNENTLSSITFDGDSLTKSAADVQVDNNNRVTIWYLVNPSVTTANISFSFSDSHEGGASIIELDGVDQTTPVDNTATETNASGSTGNTINITTNNDNSFLVEGVTFDNEDETFTWSTGTERTDFVAGSGIASRGGSATLTTTTAGSYSLTWSSTGEEIWADAVIAFNEATALTISMQAIDASATVHNMSTSGGLVEFFEDTFTDTDNTLLTAHTPDSGTGWTEVWADTTSDLEIETNLMKATANDTAVGLIYSADSNYTSADYKVEVDGTALELSTSYPVYLIARMTDQENFYSIKFTRNNFTLYKKVSGTWTQLDDSATHPAAGDTIKLQVAGTSIKGYINGAEHLSATDSSLTSAGKAGIGMGGGAELQDSSDNIRATVELDNFKANEVTAPQSVSMQSISATATLYNPSVTTGAVSVSMQAISATATLYNMTVATSAQDVSMQSISATATIHNLSVDVGAVSVSMQAIDASATLYNPSVTTTTSVSMQSIDALATPYNMSVGVGAVTISMQAISATAALHNMSVTTGAVSVAMQAIDATATLYNPSVTTGAVGVSMQSIDASATPYNMTVSAGPATISMQAIDATATLYNLTIVPGAVTVSMKAIDATASLYNMTVDTAANVAMQSIDATATLYNLSVSVGAVTVSMQAIDATAVLYSPSVTTGAVGVSMQSISSPATPYNMSVTVGGVTVELQSIDATATLYNPSVGVGAVSVTMGTVDASVTLYEMGVAYQLVMQDIDASATLYNMTVETVGAQEVTMGTITPGDQRTVFVTEEGFIYKRAGSTLIRIS